MSLHRCTITTDISLYTSHQQTAKEKVAGTETNLDSKQQETDDIQPQQCYKGSQKKNLPL